MQNSLIQILAGLAVSITVMILLVRYWKLHAFLALILAAILYGVIVAQPFRVILDSMQTGFGSLVAQIGIVVVLGAILGTLLEKSGAIGIISARLLQFFGERRAVPAMTVIGAVVGIPVFCDSGFIILSRLIQPIAGKAALNPATLTLGLSSGLFTSHTLVPPTPGPLAAASNIGLGDALGQVMITGLVITIPVVIVSSFFAKKLGNKIPVVPVKENAHISAGYASFAAFLPLLLPVILIASGSIMKTENEPSAILSVISLLGIPAVALAIGVLTAVPLIRREERKGLPGWISEAIREAGVILLITGAGGAFGAVIKNSGMDAVLKTFINDSAASGVSFLVIGYVLAALLKTAQGSTTSAMIIASSLIAPLAASAGIGSPLQQSLLVAAIGGGAMTVSHANDSYFWVVSQFGHIAAQDAFKSFTLITFVQGLVVLIASILWFMLL